ncbi:2,3,4,5-tetrahydropyridine-2,6-dicarboxylate N-acetyltransferase [Flavobacterium bizetiae]|uniref:2,3,4,5-tetrahydropyridine-2,6-dicarboxylate N-acetyltransferase n=1 Tax=Flavobacterium bizetiae TaxID=2704140 RepID=A0A6J4H1T7_9FLAO|nr:acyltransferase [Flavobacterium bizetiae]CAA9203703.1 2,3,4,5-tetrahydropyridine-2,6-dicarboxylate N-acetyltransferase [Flavobacterium bizetiae]CAD5344720.1 2,3,4,5-tetrahydropyridine-2,6-dicarboxylate N-acetyltransferase [Flavobacterium bizetiae]
MKKSIKKGIQYLVLFFYFLFPPKFFNNLRSVFNYFYTIWIRNGLNSLGNGSSLSRPIYLSGGKYISIGHNFKCDQRLRIDAIDEFLGDNFSPKIIIGDNVAIQKDCHIGAINKIVLGNNVLLASKVYISDHSHGEINREALVLPPALRKLYSKGPVIIEDNVWIGEGAVVLPNVTIGENSIIGANAVVTKSIPKNSVVGGNPARIIRELN